MIFYYTKAKPNQTKHEHNIRVREEERGFNSQSVAHFFYISFIFNPLVKLLIIIWHQWDINYIALPIARVFSLSVIHFKIIVNKNKVRRIEYFRKEKREKYKQQLILFTPQHVCAVRIRYARVWCICVYHVDESNLHHSIHGLPPSIYSIRFDSLNWNSSDFPWITLFQIQFKNFFYRITDGLPSLASLYIHTHRTTSLLCVYFVKIVYNLINQIKIFLLKLLGVVKRKHLCVCLLWVLLLLLLMCVVSIRFRAFDRIPFTSFKMIV